jgi:hypothetical protein
VFLPLTVLRRQSSRVAPGAGAPRRPRGSGTESWTGQAAAASARAGSFEDWPTRARGATPRDVGCSPVRTWRAVGAAAVIRWRPGRRWLRDQTAVRQAPGSRNTALVRERAWGNRTREVHSRLVCWEPDWQQRVPFCTLAPPKLPLIHRWIRRSGGCTDVSLGRGQGEPELDRECATVIRVFL